MSHQYFPSQDLLNCHETIQRESVSSFLHLHLFLYFPSILHPSTLLLYSSPSLIRIEERGDDTSAQRHGAGHIAVANGTSRRIQYNSRARCDLKWHCHSTVLTTVSNVSTLSLIPEIPLILSLIATFAFPYLFLVCLYPIIFPSFFFLSFYLHFFDQLWTWTRLFSSKSTTRANNPSCIWRNSTSENSPKKTGISYPPLTQIPEAPHTPPPHLSHLSVTCLSWLLVLRSWSSWTNSLLGDLNLKKCSCILIRSHSNISSLAYVNSQSFYHEIVFRFFVAFCKYCTSLHIASHCAPNCLQVIILFSIIFSFLLPPWIETSSVTYMLNFNFKVDVNCPIGHLVGHYQYKYKTKYSYLPCISFVLFIIRISFYFILMNSSRIFPAAARAVVLPLANSDFMFPMISLLVSLFSRNAINCLCKWLVIQ